MSDVKESLLAKEFQKNLKAAMDRAIERTVSDVRRSGTDSEEGRVDVAPAPVVIAVPPPSPGALGRKVLKTVANLDAAVTQELVRRPPLEPEPVDPNSPKARVGSFVGRIIRGNTR
jgi:hypothetical protein